MTNWDLKLKFELESAQSKMTTENAAIVHVLLAIVLELENLKEAFLVEMNNRRRENAT